MDWQGPGFVIAIVALSYASWMFTTWTRARHGYPLENEWSGMAGKSDLDADRKIALLTSENEAMTGEISRLEERIHVLERIATDQPLRLAKEIDSLRLGAD